MSEPLQPGLHPDPDSLNAFIEGVLPEHERLECLTHLAGCVQCREVVYLAQEPLVDQPLPAVENASFWKPWFRPIPAFSAAAVAAVVLSVALYRPDKPPADIAEMRVTAPSAMLSAPPPQQATPQLSVTPPSPKTVPEGRVQFTERAERKSIQQPETRPSAAVADPAPVPAQASSLPVAAPPVLTPPVSPLVERAASSIRADSAALNTAASPPSPTSLAGISGTVSDATGAGLPGADITVRRLSSPGIRDLKADASGQFNVAGLEPGRYELQVARPGFQQTRQQVDVQPARMARADLKLQVGAVSETVSVEAAAATVNTQSARLSAKKVVTRLEPSQLPGETTVVRGKIMLKLDSAGTLFLSDNAGKKWRAVQRVWQGKVVALTETASSPDAPFQMTTDHGAIWLSRDGSRWYAAPTPR